MSYSVPLCQIFVPLDIMNGVVRVLEEAMLYKPLNIISYYGDVDGSIAFRLRKAIGVDEPEEIIYEDIQFSVNGCICGCKVWMMCGVILLLLPTMQAQNECSVFTLILGISPPEVV